jgi:hypothetical protein
MYVFGTPFLRAFQLVFSYEHNSIGFGNKVRDFGAEIVGVGAPGPEQPWYVPGKEDEKPKPPPPPPTPPKNESVVIPIDDPIIVPSGDDNSSTVDTPGSYVPNDPWVRPNTPGSTTKHQQQ